jgi:hypothetical protein
MQLAKYDLQQYYTSPQNQIQNSRPFHFRIPHSTCSDANLRRKSKGLKRQFWIAGCQMYRHDGSLSTGRKQYRVMVSLSYEFRIIEPLKNVTLFVGRMTSLLLYYITG